MTKEQRDDAFYMAIDGYVPSAIAKKLQIEVTPELEALYWDAQEPETRWIIAGIERLNNLSRAA